MATALETAAFNALPPSVQAVITSAQAAAATAGPAISLGETIANGGMPSEAEIIGGLAAATTLVLGPLAGAAVGAIGAIAAGLQSLMTDLFTSLGLYNQVPSYHYIGLIRRGYDPVPYGPTDPNWIDVSTPAKLNSFYRNGDAHHPQLSGSWDGSMLKLLESALAGTSPSARASSSAIYGLPIHAPHTAFEPYFATILARNLQYWANAQGYVPPRQLLDGALQAWNLAHSDVTTATFTQPDQNDVYGEGSIFNDSVVSLVLGPAGDSVNSVLTGVLQDVPPILVHTGPTTPAARNIVTLRLHPMPPQLGTPSSSSSSSLTKKVAVGAAIGVGVGALGVGAYAALTGTSFLTVLKSIVGLTGVNPLPASRRRSRRRRA